MKSQVVQTKDGQTTETSVPREGLTMSQLGHSTSMPVGPVERRAIGLVMRQAERRGVIAPPSELLAITRILPWSADEVDHCLDLLVTPEGRTIGGTAILRELEGHRLGDLVLNELIEMTDDGGRILTKKGQDISALLSEYADPRHGWRSLIYESHSC